MNLRPDRRPRHRNSAFWLSLLGLLFLAVGLGVLLLGIVPTVADAQRMRSWQPVPAQLLEVKLESQRNNRGSITYRVRASYRYEFGGTEQVNHRVAVHGMADNIGDFWRRLGRRLERAHRQHKPVTAWVNPDSPDEAVLDRTLRWPLLGFWAVFGLVFGGVGGGLLVAARQARRKALAPDHARSLRGRRHRSETRENRGSWGAADKPRVAPWAQEVVPQETGLSRVAADAPSAAQAPSATTQAWLDHAAWATPAISSQARTEGWVFVVVGTVFSVIGAVASVAALPQAWNGRPIVWVVLLFPLAGLLLLWQAFKVWRRIGRYGNPSLVLDQHPAPLGGRAGMHLALPVSHLPGQRFDMALSALERHTSGSGKNRSTRESLTWEAEGQARIEATAEGILLRWSADVPAHLGPSAAPDENGRVWRVSVKGHGPVADFEARFDIPVFDTGQARTFSGEVVGDTDPWGGPRDLDEALARERLQATCQTRMDMEGALVLTQPYRRQWAMKAVWLGVGLLFLGAGAFMAHEKGGVVWMGAVFACLGLPMTTLSFWSMATRRSARLGRHAGLQARRHFLGLPVRTRHWPADAVQHLGHHLSYSMQASGQRPEHIVQVRAFLQGGGHVVLADGISSEAAARLLMADIARHTGWALRP